ncbi:MAG: hypothetical protein D6826_06900, partial [Alphaproteobacteria bacterium]
MDRSLKFLGRHARWVLFGGVLSGIAVPELAAALRPFLGLAVVLVLGTALVRVDWGHLGRYARRPVLVGGLSLWFMIVCPVVVWLLAQASGLFDALGPLAAAIVLMAAAPPILGAAGLAALLGLDAALAIVVGVVSTLLTPFTLPPLALGLLDLDLNIGLGAFMARLGIIIGAGFIGAGLIRRAVGAPWLDAHSREIDGVFALAMILFAIAIMDGVS